RNRSAIFLHPSRRDERCSNYYNLLQPAAGPLARRAIRATHPVAPVLRRRWYRRIENFARRGRARLDRQSPVERAAALLRFPRGAWWFDLLLQRFANARRDRIPADRRP